ncbi:hypothetical protein LI034_15300 [Clostridium perfringens]|nr:hypothetical protein [Clostridium perfringens]MDU7439605.1 hypothetical protein [Clostridium sp.]EJT6665633.1 hypothetical protein [Clostridium perfringens]ELC8454870.1 hypothetical protein [Clostridium perfringens]MCX0362353.1 hypothetical protein [Clostridium perfringens]MDU7550088.1 hypothetical protein [Clostridium perfringens]
MMNTYYDSEFKLLKNILFKLYIEYGLTNDIFEFSKFIDKAFLDLSKIS